MLARQKIDRLEPPDIWFLSLAYPLKARLQMIRKHYLTQVTKLIVEQKRFKETDFTVLIKNDQNKYFLEITYCYEPEYRFVATMTLTSEVVQSDVSITLVVCPGGMFKREKIENVSTTQLEGQIKNWLSRLANELASIPIQRQFDEQQQEIQSILEQLDDIPRDYLSRQEAVELAAKLDEMEARLTKNLEETVTNQSQLQSKVKTITDDMAVLKEDMKVLSKRGWAKAFVTRTFEWAKDPANRKMLTTGAQVAKDLLLEAGKSDPPTPPPVG